MKKLFIISILLWYAIISMAQTDSIIIAVFEETSEDVTPKLGKVIREEFIAYLVSQKYKVVERAQIEQMLKEPAFQRKGFVSDNQIIKLGEMTGANYVCYILITMFRSQYHLSCKFAEVKTAEISSAETGHISEKAELPEIKQEINLIAGKMFSEWPAGKWECPEMMEQFVLYNDNTGRIIIPNKSFVCDTLKWEYNEKENKLTITKFIDSEYIFKYWENFKKDKDKADTLYKYCPHPYIYTFYFERKFAEFSDSNGTFRYYDFNSDQQSWLNISLEPKK